MERRVGLLSDTISERPAELRPIPCPHCQGQQHGKSSNSLKKSSTIHVQGEAPESDDSSRDCKLSEFIYICLCFVVLTWPLPRRAPCDFQFVLPPVLVGCS
jgi:hypothetical protein